MGQYVSNVGEKKNPLSSLERAIVGKLAEELASMYVQGPMHRIFRDRLDGLGTSGVLQLIHSLSVLSRFDDLSLKIPMTSVENCGGIDYLVKQLPWVDREEIKEQLIKAGIIGYA